MKSNSLNLKYIGKDMVYIIIIDEKIEKNYNNINTKINILTIT